MATNKELLTKGIKYLFGALPLMFIGPTVFYNSLMNKHTSWHYLVLALGCSLCLLGGFLAFKGLKTMTDSLFNDTK